MATTIYKICDKDLWRIAQSNGQFTGNSDDRRDGFIHMSGPDQLVATAQKHYSGRQNLVLLAVNAEKLGSALIWEASRGGDLFPHLYGDLSVSDVANVWDLPLGPTGMHQFPEDLD